MAQIEPLIKCLAFHPSYNNSGVNISFPFSFHWHRDILRLSNVPFGKSVKSFGKMKNLKVCTNSFDDD